VPQYLAAFERHAGRSADATFNLAEGGSAHSRRRPLWLVLPWCLNEIDA
jgi:hypothetical protein